MFVHNRSGDAVIQTSQTYVISNRYFFCDRPKKQGLKLKILKMRSLQLTLSLLSARELSVVQCASVSDYCDPRNGNCQKRVSDYCDPRNENCQKKVSDYCDPRDGNCMKKMWYGGFGGGVVAGAIGGWHLGTWPAGLAAVAGGIVCGGVCRGTGKCIDMYHAQPGKTVSKKDERQCVPLIHQGSPEQFKATQGYGSTDGHDRLITDNPEIVKRFEASRMCSCVNSSDDRGDQ